MIFELLSTLNQWLQPYKGQVAVALVTTFLVIYGDVVNKWVKKRLKPFHFIIRTMLFVLVCSFGYSLLVLTLSPLVETLLDHAPWPYLPLLLVAVAVIVGVLAEKRRYI